MGRVNSEVADPAEIKVLTAIYREIMSVADSHGQCNCDLCRTSKARSSKALGTPEEPDGA